MRVVSVNVSPVRHLEYNGHPMATAILKRPLAGRVMFRRQGLDGDAQADRVHHGGPDMAVYTFSLDHYQRWATHLGRADFEPGIFGENLTVTGMLESEVCIGDRFQIGEVELEASLPRAPCSKLAMVMRDPEFPKVFLASCDVGFYSRVIREGTIGAGDAITQVHSDPARLSISEVTRLMFFDRDNREGAARAAAVDTLAEKWRQKFRERLSPTT